MLRYAVIVKGPFEEPWQESIWDDPHDAQGRKEFLEAAMLGAKVIIDRYEIEED